MTSHPFTYGSHSQVQNNHSKCTHTHTPNKCICFTNDTCTSRRYLNVIYDVIGKFDEWWMTKLQYLRIWSLVFFLCFCLFLLYHDEYQSKRFEYKYINSSVSLIGLQIYNHQMHLSANNNCIRFKWKFPSLISSSNLSRVDLCLNDSFFFIFSAMFQSHLIFNTY